MGFAGRLEPLRASAGSRSQIKPILNSPEMKVGKSETGQGFLTNILMIIDDVVMTKPICSWKTSVGQWLERLQALPEDVEVGKLASTSIAPCYVLDVSVVYYHMDMVSQCQQKSLKIG